MCGSREEGEYPKPKREKGPKGEKERQERGLKRHQQTPREGASTDKFLWRRSRDIYYRPSWESIYLARKRRFFFEISQKANPLSKEFMERRTPPSKLTNELPGPFRFFNSFFKIRNNFFFCYFVKLLIIYEILIISILCQRIWLVRKKSEILKKNLSIEGGRRSRKRIIRKVRNF